MTETDPAVVRRLAWLLESQRQAELAYQRAKWQLSYFKKEKAEYKKIEEVRLNVLAKQKNLLDVRKKLQAKIGIARNKLGAVIRQDNGVTVTFRYPKDPKHTAFDSDWHVVDAEHMAQMADEYEAEKVFNKVLSCSTQS
jgi:hypothetical protein